MKNSLFTLSETRQFYQQGILSLAVSKNKHFGKLQSFKSLKTYTTVVEKGLHAYSHIPQLYLKIPVKKKLAESPSLNCLKAKVLQSVA